MKTKDSIPDWEDIIFENRNKMYGAYELRTHYNSRLTKALTITIISSLTIFFLLYILRSKDGTASFKTKNDPVTFTDINFPKKIFSQEIKEHIRTTPITQKTDVNSFQAITDSIVKQATDTTSIQVLASTGTSSDPTLSEPGMEGASFPNGNPMNTLPPYNMATVDKSPEFPGGMSKFYKFLLRHIHYTDEARKAGLIAKMYIQFIIDENGIVQEVELMNRIGFGLDEEVQKALLNSPHWLPGLVKNEPVKTVMILPVSFDLVQ